MLFSGDEDHSDEITSPEMPRPRYPLDERCPDCKAEPGEDCHVDRSTRWA